MARAERVLVMMGIDRPRGSSGAVGTATSLTRNAAGHSRGGGSSGVRRRIGRCYWRAHVLTSRGARDASRGLCRNSHCCRGGYGDGAGWHRGITSARAENTWDTRVWLASCRDGCRCCLCHDDGLFRGHRVGLGWWTSTTLPTHRQTCGRALRSCEGSLSRCQSSNEVQMTVL